MKQDLSASFTVKEKIERCLVACRFLEETQLSRSQQVLLKNLVVQLLELGKMTDGHREVPLFVALATRVALQAVISKLAEFAYHFFHDNPQ